MILFLIGIRAYLSKLDGENRMRTTRDIVHVCGCRGSIQIAAADELTNVVVVDHRVLGEILHVHTGLGMFANFERLFFAAAAATTTSFLRRRRRRSQQIANFLVVDLEIAHLGAIITRVRRRIRG